MPPCHCALPLRHARKIVLELVRGEEARDAVIVVAEGDQHLFEVPSSERGN